jgi:hypothetical protein
VPNEVTVRPHEDREPFRVGQFDQPTVVLSELVGIQRSQTLRVEQQILFYLIPNGV